MDNTVRIVDYGNTFAHIVYTNARWTTSSLLPTELQNSPYVPKASRFKGSRHSTRFPHNYRLYDYA